MQNMPNDICHRGTGGHNYIAQMFIDQIASRDQIADRLHDLFFNTAPDKPIFVHSKDLKLQKLLANIP
jgi:hypothetical protein